MAIAWAVIEHLATGPARPARQSRRPTTTSWPSSASDFRRSPAAGDGSEERGRLTFPHRIEPGAADRSFGIEVARLAGMPDDVLRRARHIATAIAPVARDLVACLENRVSADG